MPANNFRTRPLTTITNKGRVKDFPPPSDQGGDILEGAVLVPGVPVHIRVEWPPKVTPEQAQAISAKKLWVFVFGTATYDLPGGGEGRTDYCYIYDVDKDCVFMPYGEGNRAK